MIVSRRLPQCSIMYAIKELYYTIQGEGYHTGRPAVFCRFSGCNLWTGLEKDRENAICKFCDTNFWGTDGLNGGKYTLEALVQMIKSVHPNGQEIFVVFTGGEPALQLDEPLVSALHDIGAILSIETNGTLSLPDGLDWITVSPKANTEILVTKGNELKLVFPQIENQPQQYEDLDFEHLYLQPMDGLTVEESTKRCIQYCKENPQWKLSLQTHKILGIL